MEINALKTRFKTWAVTVAVFAEKIPLSAAGRNAQNQMIRSSSSSAANYRAACRRRSQRDFIAKLGIVEEELDETLFWMEYVVALDEQLRAPIHSLWKEGDELLAITVASIKTAKHNQQLK